MTTVIEKKGSGLNAVPIWETLHKILKTRGRPTKAELEKRRKALEKSDLQPKKWQLKSLATGKKKKNQNLVQKEQLEQGLQGYSDLVKLKKWRTR